MPSSPVLFDTNVFINALMGRGLTLPRALAQSFSDAFVAAPSRAELSWLIGRLDPDHPGTARAVGEVKRMLSHIDPAKVLVPTDADWLAAGELAGRTARAIAGGAKAIATAAHRQELIGDAITAILARSAGLTIITEDADFDVLARLAPGLSVLFYDRT